MSHKDSRKSIFFAQRLARVQLWKIRTLPFFKFMFFIVTRNHSITGRIQFLSKSVFCSVRWKGKQPLARVQLQRIGTLPFFLIMFFYWGGTRPSQGEACTHLTWLRGFGLAAVRSAGLHGLHIINGHHQGNNQVRVTFVIDFNRIGRGHAEPFLGDAG